MKSLHRLVTFVAACVVLTSGSFAQQSGGVVPPPKRIVVTTLPDIRNWSLVAGTEDPLPHLEFTADLDMLAPLGTGGGNSAVYFAHFAHASGDRGAELAKIELVEVEGIGKVYRAGEPVLLEAERWVDVATMKFYPDVLALAGATTELPNMLHFMTLGRSWSARAAAATDREAAKEDYRRVVRLGRLVRQQSVTAIDELVGLALIKMGTSGLYQVARAEGDSPTMTVAALVSAEASMFREIVRSSLPPLTVRSGETVDGTRLERIVRAARESGFRPMRGKALVSLYVVANTGAKAAREKAVGTIASLAADADPIVAADARHYQKLKWTPELAAILKK